MILTCPNCDAQFAVGDNLIGDEGRKVKCSSCSNVWFQEPVVEAVEEEGFPSGESIDEAIDEALEEVAGKIHEENEGEYEIPSITPEAANPNEFIAQDTPEEKKAKKVSYAAAVTFFFLIFFYYYLNAQSIMREDPSMQAFYSLMGVRMNLPGEGLIFDKVSVDDNGSAIKVAGNIINLSVAEQELPPLEAFVIDGEENILASWIIKPDKHSLEAEEVHKFESLYYKPENLMTKDTKVKVRFSLKSDSKTDGEGDGNNQAHHQGESDHQSDHEVSLESHPPVFAVPHPALSLENHAPGRSLLPDHQTDDQADHSSEEHH
ncbi:MAG: hypothetical protein GC137_01700 [Alphaproteobacteria bacterium]|nr:hypothetical protein [Alphaproteobacteria bacterium]